MIDIETKLKLSEILISWTKEGPKSLEIKVFLRGKWTSLIEDIALYVNQLSEEGPTEENRPAFKFLREKIELLIEVFARVESSDIPQEIIQNRIETIMQEFKKAYPEQEEIRIRLEGFISVYNEMSESLRN